MLTALMLSLCLSTAPRSAPKPVPAAAAPAKPTLAERSPLPALARQFLKRRMASHALDASSLMFSVVLLQRAEVKEISHRIASEPQLSKPLPGDDESLNVQLPGRFFTLQSELKLRAQRLEEAASGTDDRKLGEAFGQLTQTCVACHSAFLEAPAAEEKP